MLGVDNVIFLAIVTQDVPLEKRDRIRKLGLGLALIGRIVMVLGISWLLGLDETLFTLMGHAFSIKDVILLSGGLFLTYKAVTEIYKATELKEEEEEAPASPPWRAWRGSSRRSWWSTWSSPSTRCSPRSD